MANPHGTPIWYELLTPDPDAAKGFYDAIVGWTIESAPAGPIDYRMITAADGNVGGTMRLTDEMKAGGAQSGWLFYIGVDDVDATAGRITAAGGAILMPPFDLPGVGRMAFVADPQGAPFYIMRGASDGESGAFSATPVDGHCAWNELWTSDVAGAIDFYREVFGWENPNTMDMGPMGGYHFLHLGDSVLGALARSQGEEQPPRWVFYFAVPDLDAALARAEAAGGTLTRGPHDVPGPMRIFVGTDPHGATFALVGPARNKVDEEI